MTALTITYGAESPNTLIRSSRWNQNVSDIQTWANGNNFDETFNIKPLSITNASIATNAVIANSKLNLASISQVVAMSSSTFKQAQGANVASATTTTLGEDGNFFFITGTTTITSITAKAAGTVVILKFNGILTLTNGSNLKLISDFVTAAGDTINLISDGTNWWEISRLRSNGAGFENLANIPSGAGIIPAANLPGQTFKFISKTSVSAAVDSGNIAITSTNYYMVTINIKTMSASDSISFRFNNDSTASNYRWVYRGFDTTATAANGNSSSAALMQLCPAIVTSNSGSSFLIIYIFPQPGTGRNVAKWHMWGDLNAGTEGYVDGFGLWANSAAATSFIILTTGGNNMTGDINLYQIQQQ